MKFVLILACSSKKADVERCAAGDLYKGEIFKKGQSIAIEHAVPYWILSAKYGIITPDQIIDNYDEKLASAYKGPFPPETYRGMYVGGQLYFKKFPKSFVPLVGPAPIGKMLQELKYLVDNPNAAYKKMSDWHRNNAPL